MAIAEQPVLGGTDGYRGNFTTEPGPGRMNADTICGLAAATAMQPEVRSNDGPYVVLRDTRPSSPVLLEAVTDGLQLASAGDIVNLGVSPTPMGQLVAKHLGASATFVVTASHNPAHQNGLKYMLGHAKPNDEQVQAISDTYYRNLEKPAFGLATEIVSTERRAELTEWYHDSVVATISNQFGEGVLTDKLFVYDGARGAAKELAPRILESLGATVIRFACDDKGLINDGVGAANIAEAADKNVTSGVEAYLRQNPWIAKDPRFVGVLANDGDGDRVLGLSARRERGIQYHVINGNHIMWALAQGEDGIVGTEYTNTGLRNALTANKIGFADTKNGDRHVTMKLEVLQAAGDNWFRGGEPSGHLIDTRWLCSGDGVFNAAWYAADTVSRSMTFASRLEEVRLWPEKMRTVSVPRDQAKQYISRKETQSQFAKWRKELGDAGRLIIRASGTEDVIRVWGEARAGRDINQVTRYIARHIARGIELSA